MQIKLIDIYGFTTIQYHNFPHEKYHMKISSTYKPGNYFILYDNTVIRLYFTEKYELDYDSSLIASTTIDEGRLSNFSFKYMHTNRINQFWRKKDKEFFFNLLDKILYCLKRT